mmetsp:Transcript_58080/g.129650  ORF Transcript_58080/g.129650 Transcript_58080/m.129650 type:complete len:204 (-) Transcript_58080:26-637(-)
MCSLSACNFALLSASTKTSKFCWICAAAFATDSAVPWMHTSVSVGTALDWTLMLADVSAMMATRSPSCCRGPRNLVGNVSVRDTRRAASSTSTGAACESSAAAAAAPPRRLMLRLREEPELELSESDSTTVTAAPFLAFALLATGCTQTASSASSSIRWNSTQMSTFSFKSPDVDFRFVPVAGADVTSQPSSSISSTTATMKY